MELSRGPHLVATDTYEDITEILRKQANSLGDGGFQQLPGAHMFDSLPAFQIGVHKLDTGVPAEFKTLDEELKEAESKFPLNSESHAVILMDLLKRSEMAWQNGYSGMQTLLACLLVDEELQRCTKQQLAEFKVDLAIPETWDIKSLMQVYVWSIIRSMSICMLLAMREGARVIFMEEDFHSNRYDLYFLDDAPVQTVVEMVDRARKAASNLGYKDLADRLNMQSVWLTVLNQRIPKKRVNLHKMQQLISEWAASCKQSSGDDDEIAYKAWFTTGSQPRANMACLRHPLKIYSVDEAQEMWTKIVSGIEKLVSLNSIQRSTDLLGFLLNFSSRQEPPMVRAILRTRYPTAEIQSFGQTPKHWTELDIKETLAIPPALLQNHECKTAFETFTAQAGLCYADLITGFAMNRCRLREMLCEQAVSFDSLQVQADETDAILSKSLGMTVALTSSWTLFRKLQVMLWVVLIGIETDIINYREHAYTYWYAHQLCQYLVRHIQRMRQSFEVIPGARNSPGYAYLAALELESQMLQQLCMAEMLLWIAIHKIKPPKPVAHISPETQFKLRFRMFESIGVPEMPNLKEFEEFQGNWEIKLALQGAANASKTARTLLTQLKTLATDNAELELLLRSAMALSIAVMKFVTKLDSPPQKIENTRESYHPYFPVPELS